MKMCPHKPAIKIPNGKRKYPQELPIGSERITDKKRGFVLIKVSNDKDVFYCSYKGKWKRKHIVLWEQHNGPVPKGYNVIFLDGNKTNFELDNLALATRNEIMLLHRFGLQFDDKEMTKNGLAIIRHKVAVANLIKEKYGYISYYKYNKNNKTPSDKKPSGKHTPKKGSKYTPEIISFMKQIAKKAASDIDLLESVNKRFCVSFTYRQLKNIKYVYGITIGRGAPLYSEAKNSRGYTLIKILEKGKYNQKWVRKDRWVWEQENGQIPLRHDIIFADQNKNNCAIENLICVSYAVIGYMAYYHLFSTDPEMTKTAVALANHRIALKSVRRENA